MVSIRNEYISGTAQFVRFEDKVRETRLALFGHVQRRDSAFGSSRQDKQRKIQEDVLVP